MLPQDAFPQELFDYVFALSTGLPSRIKAPLDYDYALLAHHRSSFLPLLLVCRSFYLGLRPHVYTLASFGSPERPAPASAAELLLKPRDGVAAVHPLVTHLSIALDYFVLERDFLRQTRLGSVRLLLQGKEGPSWDERFKTNACSEKRTLPISSPSFARHLQIYGDLLDLLGPQLLAISLDARAGHPNPGGTPPGGLGAFAAEAIGSLVGKVVATVAADGASVRSLAVIMPDMTIPVLGWSVDGQEGAERGRQAFHTENWDRFRSLLDCPPRALRNLRLRNLFVYGDERPWGTQKWKNAPVVAMPLLTRLTLERFAGHVELSALLAPLCASLEELCFTYSVMDVLQSPLPFQRLRKVTHIARDSFWDQRDRLHFAVALCDVLGAAPVVECEFLNWVDVHRLLEFAFVAKQPPLWPGLRKGTFSRFDCSDVDLDSALKALHQSRQGMNSVQRVYGPGYVFFGPWVEEGAVDPARRRRAGAPAHMPSRS